MVRILDKSIYSRSRRLNPSVNTRISKNARNAKKKNREKFGIRITNSTKEAFYLDRINNNKNWEEASNKEMSALDRLDCFEFVPRTTESSKADGWQFAPMHMIYDIKQEDLRHKARFVIYRWY